MGVIEDLMLTLERIPIWKRLIALPAEIERLQARIASLEARLAPTKGAICPKCREPHFMLESAGLEPGPFAVLGVQQYRYRCHSCSFEDVREEPL